MLWVHLTVSYYHLTYEFQSESTLYSLPECQETPCSKQAVWLNGWGFVYELSGCALESCCCQLNFKYGTCFEQGAPWHSGKLWCVDSETRTWHDNKIQLLSNLLIEHNSLGSRDGLRIPQFSFLCINCFIFTNNLTKKQNYIVKWLQLDSNPEPLSS